MAQQPQLFRVIITLSIVTKHQALGPSPPDPENWSAADADQALLHGLIERGPCTATQLAQHLRMHVNTVRPRLFASLESRLVQREPAPAAGRGRPAHLYWPTTAGRAALHRASALEEYRGLTAAFVQHLAGQPADPGEQSRQIGRAWGRQLAGSQPDDGGPTDPGHGPDQQVLGLLDRLQFTPEPRRDDVALRTCPLLELATQHPEVVCQVHLGLVQGALRRYGATDDQAELDPFAEPGACRLRLHPSTPAS